MASRQNLSSKLARARQQLHKAQIRVAALEAEVLDGLPHLADPTGNEERYRRIPDTPLEDCPQRGVEQEEARQQAEAAIKRYAARMEILHQIDIGIINASSVEAIVETALKQIRAFFACEQAFVGLFDNETNESVIFACDLARPFEVRKGTRLPTRRGTFDEFGTGKVVVIDDLQRLPEAEPAYASVKQAGLRSALRASLTFQGDSIGLLALNAAPPDFFMVEHQEIAAEIADQLAIAIHQLRLSEQLARHAAELEQKVAARTADLTNSKQRIEAILNNSLDCILLVDPDLTIHQANSATSSLFAAPPDTYLGNSLTTLLYEEDVKQVIKLIAAVVAEQQGQSIEIRALRKNGTCFDAELKIGIIEGNDLVCTLSDITERKAHERQLRYHASMQAGVSDAVIATDMDFRIQSWNRAAERIYGWSAVEAIGKSANELLQTIYESVVDRTRILQDFLEHGAWQGEVIQHHRDGHPINILLSVNLFKDEAGHPAGTVAVNRDITERKQVEAVLQKSAAEIHDLYNNAPCGYHSLDEDGLIIQINDTELRWLGYTRDEVVGKLKITEICTPESLSIYQKLRPALIKQGWFNSVEVELVRKDGSIIDILLNATAIYDDDGQFLRSRATLFDITERQQAEESLRESEERFRRAILDAPFPIMIHADNGEVLHISNVWTEISGYTHAEIPTMADWIEKAYRESSQTVRPLIEKVYALTKPRRGGEFRIWTKAGEERIWEFISAPLAIMSDGRRMVSSMAMDITERKHMEDALQTKLAEERQFQIHLKALHEIIVELTSIEQLDRFYKRAVELGRERLGFDRLAMFLYDAQDDSAIGTYGTDVQGNLVDERGVRFSPDPNGIMRRSFDRVERFYLKEETTLYNEEVAVGYGWNAAAVLWNGSRSLGWFVTDNLLRQEPASKSLLDIIGLYALAVGTLLAQKQTRLALQESEALYRLLGENISDLIMRSTLTSECLYISPSVQPLLGYTPEELIGQQTFGQVHPDDQPILGAAYAAALERNDLILPHQYRARHKDGHYIWLETVGKPLFRDGSNEIVELITSSRDVTARKQAEAAVRESEARYRLLAENLADIVMTFSLDRQITYMSPSCEKLLGYSPEEVEGKSHSEFIHPEDYPQVLARTRQAVIAKEHSYTNQFRLRHKAGHYIWYEVRTRVVWDPVNGNILQFASVLRDITERKEAEDALRESEGKFRLLLDAAPVATIISDQAGRILLVNVQAELLFGYNRTELTGEMVEILVPEAVHGTHVNKRMTYIAAPRVRPMGLGMELYARCKDGHEVPVEIELSYIDTQDGIMVISFIMDITERKRIAAELEQQRTFLRNVIDVSPSMIFVKDYNGRFVLVNPSVARLYNTTIDALVGKTDADFNPNLQEVDDFLAADRLVITSGNMLFVEEPITNSLGKMRWLQTTKVPMVSADGQSKYVLGVSTDITERRVAEEALRASEEKYRSLVETMRGGLAVFDTEFRVTFVNDRFCELLGYDSAEVIGKQPLSFVDTADIPLVQSHIGRRQGAESSSYEIPIRHKDGHQIYMLMSGSPLLDEQGKYNGSIVVATDITIQKQAEEALRQALAREKELGDLKTRFVSMASHEFRTPLAVIFSVVETLSIYRHKLSGEQIDQRLEKIKEQIEHLTAIMEDVLTLSRMQARHVEFNPGELDLDALVHSILDEFQNQSESKHQLDYTVSGEIHGLLLDRKLMRQIISNLLSNAIKYSPTGTVVRIHLAYTEAAVILSVSDEGIGIPEADLPHLFTPFHRADNVGTISGTGLGLVITREAVELQGGTIAVESQPGVGTTFLVHLPVRS